MKKLIFTLISLMCLSSAHSQVEYKNVATNAVRIQYGNTNSGIPDWIYVKNNEVDNNITVNNYVGKTVLQTPDGKSVTAFDYRIGDKATVKFSTTDDEFLYGLGQFQDGHSNLAGLSRHLTQVNTQISVPVVISSKGYGIIWNNYAKTIFNPLANKISLVKSSEKGETETVDVTSTEGGKQETRKKNIYTAEIEIAEDGKYSLLLDVGQKMARRHNLEIDGKTVIEMQNLWLPPTASAIVSLSKGKHTLKAELTENDRPIVHYGKVKNEMVFQTEGEGADFIDFTVIFGTADEIIKTYRDLTGHSPMLPKWAFGYIHCRERYHSQDEIIKTADKFISENIPLDVIVQDWQYWGNTGWNSMVFDPKNYPSPKSMTDYLHSKNIRFMLSVWSKIDKNSEVGKEMQRAGYYIPNTDWIDFFNPEAAAAYWKNFSTKLLPLGIDAWWQDATEPENDDLENRIVRNGTLSGNRVRNVYPMLVNKTVYEGLTKDQPNRRPMILTRSGFLGIQRYGSALWSGDVGNDWETLRRQITGGLGLQAAGVPWWTYDAGGFFRPRDQYNNQDYINRMLRWIELSVYLPLMRVHGYMSDTEPWMYGAQAQEIITNCINRRKQLTPYIYSNAAEVSFNGSTLMRPLVFDFPNDPKALQQKYEYMFGKSLLISPVTEPDVTQWQTYLPENEGGWYDTNHQFAHYNGGQTVTTEIDQTQIPVFAKAGSIYVEKIYGDYLAINVLYGNNAEFTLYDDDGISTDYQNSIYQYSKILFSWNNAAKTLTIESLGSKKAVNQTFEIAIMGLETHKESHIQVGGFERTKTTDIKGAGFKTIKYNGKKKTIKFK